MTVQWTDLESIDLTIGRSPSSNDQSQYPSGDFENEDILSPDAIWADTALPIAKSLSNEIPRTHWMTSRALALGMETPELNQHGQEKVERRS